MLHNKEDYSEIKIKHKTIPTKAEAIGNILQ